MQESGSDKNRKKGKPLVENSTKPNINNYPMVKIDIYEELWKNYPLISRSGAFVYIAETVEVEDLEEQDEDSGLKGYLRAVNIENHMEPFEVSKSLLPYPVKCIYIGSEELTSFKCAACGRDVHIFAKFCGFCKEPVSEGTLDNIRSAKKDGNFIYIAEEIDYLETEKGTKELGGGLRVMDISDPSDPKEAGYYQMQMLINSISMSGKYGYVAGVPADRKMKKKDLDAKTGLRIIDISDPGIIFECGFVHILNPLDICIDGKYAYIAGGDEGLLILDISNPFKPKIAAKFSTPDTAKTVFVHNNIAYVGGDEFVETDGSDVTDGSESSMENENEYFVGGYNEGGLCLIDVSDPLKPRRIEYYDTGNIEHGKIFVTDSLAFIADLSTEIKVLDISDPRKIVDLGKVEGFRDVHASGDHVFIVSPEHLGVIFLSSPGETKMVEPPPKVEKKVPPMAVKVEKDLYEKRKCEVCGDLMPANAVTCPRCEAEKEKAVPEIVPPEPEEEISTATDDMPLTSEEEAKLTEVLERLKALKSEITIEDKKPSLKHKKKKRRIKKKKKKEKDYSQVAKCLNCGDLIPADSDTCPRCNSKKEVTVTETVTPEEEEIEVDSATDESTSEPAIETSLNNLMKRLKTLKDQTPIEDRMVSANTKMLEVDIELAICGSCGELNPVNIKSCPKCGVSFTGVYECPNCHAELNQDATRCDNCGMEFEAPPEDDEEKQD